MHAYTHTVSLALTLRCSLDWYNFWSGVTQPHNLTVPLTSRHMMFGLPTYLQSAQAALPVNTEAT